MVDPAPSRESFRALLVSVSAPSQADADCGRVGSRRGDGRPADQKHSAPACRSKHDVTPLEVVSLVDLNATAIVLTVIVVMKAELIRRRR